MWSQLTSVNLILDNWTLATLVHFGNRLFSTGAVDVARSVYNSLEGVALPTKDVVSVITIASPNKLSKQTNLYGMTHVSPKLQTNG